MQSEAEIRQKIAEILTKKDALQAEVCGLRAILTRRKRLGKLLPEPVVAALPKQPELLINSRGEVVPEYLKNDPEYPGRKLPSGKWVFPGEPDFPS